MNILSIYGSNTGNTEALMFFIRTLFNKSNCNFKLINAKNSSLINKITNFINYDLVILSSPTWGGRAPTLQDDFAFFWTNLNKDIIFDRKFAIIGLGDIYYPNFCKAIDFISDDIVKYNGILIANSLAIPDPWDNHISIITLWVMELITKLQSNHELTTSYSG